MKYRPLAKIICQKKKKTRVELMVCYTCMIDTTFEMQVKEHFACLAKIEFIDCRQNRNPMFCGLS
jgi:hypothetical protein